MFDRSPVGFNSPLVLDLDGDGIETTKLGFTSATSSAVYFDLDNDGFAERTGWVAGGDGLLVWDKNSNDVIDNQSELFGDSSTYADGFAYLDSLDSNNDGKITSSDTNWVNLSVWIDANIDGITDDGELTTLSSLNITEFDLSVTPLTNTYNNENLVSATSTFKINGVDRAISDVWFRNDSVDSRYLGNVTLNSDIFFLPTLKGYGEMKDLHVAMSEDGDLLSLVEDFVDNWSTERFGDKPALDDEIRDILFAWAGVENVNPTSRGTYCDARELAFLENYLGKRYKSPSNNDYPDTSPQGQNVDVTFDYFLANLGAQLIAQSGLSDLYSDVPIYNYVYGELRGGTLSTSALSDLSSVATASGDADDYWTAVAATLINVKDVDNFTSAEIAALDAAIQSSLPTSSWTTILSQAIVPFSIYWWSSAFSDLIGGGNGADFVSSGAGDDVVKTFEGNDGVNGGDGDDEIYGGIGNDNINGNSGNDFLSGGAGNDTLSGETGDDQIYAGEGNDLIYGGDDNDDVYGEGGIDEIYAGAGNDYISGGAGNDTLSGGAGDDIFHFEIGFGVDVVSQYNDESGTDILQLGEGITISDLRFYRPTGSSDIVIGVGASDSIRLTNHLADLRYSTNDYDEIDSIRLFDTTTISLLQNLVLTGTTSSEYFYGSNGSDTIIGLAGNDYLYGENGDDTYVFDAGFGQDIVQDDSGTDEIRFGTGIGLNDLRFYRGGNSGSLELFVGSSDKITIYNQFYDIQFGGNAYDEVEFIRFADDSVFNLMGSLTFSGTSSSEYVYGTKANDTLKGLAGDDYLYAEDGNDTIEGGDGGDFMSGDAGNDTYIYALGDGSDTIAETSGTDGLMFGAGITTENLTLADYSIADTRITFSSNANVLTLSNNRLSGYEIEALEFEDGFRANLLTYQSWVWGTSSGQTTNGTSGVDTIFGREGDDTINGLAGADAIHGGSGGDTINGGDGNDQLFGGDGNDTLSGDANDDFLNGGAGNDNYHFASGTDTIVDTGGTDKIYLPTSIDISEVFLLRFSDAQNDLRIRVGHSDSANGAWLGDIIVTNQFAGATTHVETLRIQDGAGYDVSLTSAYVQTLGTGGSDVIYGVGYGASPDDQITDLVGTNDVISSGAGSDVVYAGAGNDTVSAGADGDAVFGMQGDDAISGDGGSDYLYGDYDGTEGYGGADTLYGGAGSDWMFGGAGNDALSGEADADLLYGQAGNDTLYGGDGDDYLYGDYDGTEVYTGGSDVVYGGAGADWIEGGDASDTLYGDGGADVIQGQDGDDYIIGGDGLDSVSGGSGADTFIFKAASAFNNIDVIYDFSTAQGDKLHLTDVLQGFDPLTDAITDFVEITTSGSNSLLKIDADGGGNAFVQVATLIGVTGLTDEGALLTNGNLIAA